MKYHIRYNKKLNTINIWWEENYEFQMWEIETLGL